MFILLVEDDHFFASMMQELLRQNGYTDIKHFDNGLECLLQVYEEKVPDIVIMDYHLGLVNGLEILQKIRAYKPSLKVIFMSGQKDVRVAVDSIKKGARDYIIKDEKAFERLLAVLKEIGRELEQKEASRPVNKIVSRLRNFLTFND